MTRDNTEPVHGENWFFDTDPQSAQIRDRFRLFQYKWIYTPTNQSNTRKVYCENAEVFLRLLERWNQTSNWQFIVIKPEDNYENIS